MWKTNDGGINGNPSPMNIQDRLVGATSLESDLKRACRWESPIRGIVSLRDGVYKSTDAEKPKHIGPEIRARSRVRVHPRNLISFLWRRGHVFDPMNSAVRSARLGSKIGTKALSQPQSRRHRPDPIPQIKHYLRCAGVYRQP